MVISLAVDFQHLHVIIGATSKKGLFSCHRFWESSSFAGFKDAGNQQEVIVPASTSQLLETLKIWLVRGSLTFLIQARLQPVCQCMDMSWVTHAGLQDFVYSSDLKKNLDLFLALVSLWKFLTAVSICRVFWALVGTNWALTQRRCIPALDLHLELSSVHGYKGDDLRCGLLEAGTLWKAVDVI